MPVDSSPAPRIALLLPTLTGGGAERVTLNLIEGLRALHCTVDLVLFTATGDLADAIPEGVNVVDLRCGRALWSPGPLARYLRRARPAAMIATMGHANLAALLARRLAGIPTRLVLTEHLAVSPRPEGWKDVTYRFLARRAYPSAEAVVAVSDGLADTFAAGVGLPRDSVTVIYNPVLTERYWRAAAELVDHRFFGSDQPPVVLGVGRLVPQKDFVNLVKAFARVRSERMARLVILGEGPLRPDLEALVRDLGLEADVDLPGFVGNSIAYMARSAVFALSSVREGLPTVLIEALAAGVAVVSTDCESGPREILEGGRLGRLVPVGDPGALAGAIREALDAPRATVDRESLAVYSPIEAARRYLRAAGLHE